MWPHPERGARAAPGRPSGGSRRARTPSREDCRRYASHATPASGTPCTGELVSRCQDRRAVRLRCRGPWRVVDSRRAGVAPRRRCPCAGPRGLAPGAKTRVAWRRILRGRIGLGVRDTVGLDTNARPPARASGVRPEWCRSPVAHRTDAPYARGVRDPRRGGGARRVGEGRRAGQHPAVRCDHVQPRVPLAVNARFEGVGYSSQAGP